MCAAIFMTAASRVNEPRHVVHRAIRLSTNLANEVLHTPMVVLHRLVEPLFLEGQVPALPFCDDLPLPDVSLVPKTILPWLDPRLQEAIFLEDAGVMSDAYVRPRVADREAWAHSNRQVAQP